MKQHIEILNVSKNNESYSIVKIYKWDEKHLRVCFNEIVSCLISKNGKVLDNACEGVELTINTDEEKNFLLVANWMDIVVPIPIDCLRLTSFNVTDKGKSHNTTTLIKGNTPDNWMGVITIDNRKFKDNL